MNMVFKIIGLNLTLAVFGFAASPSEVELKIEGKVDIGGIFYSEEEMADPQKRKNAEIIAQRLEQLKKIQENNPVDFSGWQSQEVFDQLLFMALQQNLWVVFGSGRSPS